jgi:hypothetical protein
LASSQRNTCDFKSGAGGSAAGDGRTTHAIAKPTEHDRVAIGNPHNISGRNLGLEKSLAMLAPEC